MMRPGARGFRNATEGVPYRAGRNESLQFRKMLRPPAKAARGGLLGGLSFRFGTHRNTSYGEGSKTHLPTCRAQALPKYSGHVRPTFEDTSHDSAPTHSRDRHPTRTSLVALARLHPPREADPAGRGPRLRKVADHDRPGGPIVPWPVIA